MLSFAANFATVLADIGWDPEIRNIVSLAIGIIVLVGSVLLLISTNTGPRTGLLVTLACLMGWMTLMGLVWWVYGIGMKGEPAHWRVTEINRGELAAAANEEATRLPTLDRDALVEEILDRHPELNAVVNPESRPDKVPTIGELVEADPAIKAEFGLEPDDLGGWHILEPSNKQRGDAQASADAALGPNGQGVFESTSDYKVLEAYDRGGKNHRYGLSDGNQCDVRLWDPHLDGCWERVRKKILKTVNVTHPEHFAIVQVQRVIEQPAPAGGGAPPTPQVDEDAPVYSVIMIRSLGDTRFPAFMVFLTSGVLFVILCRTLHRRDQLIAGNLAAAG